MPVVATPLPFQGDSVTPAVWILANGVWNDEGIWDDDATWEFSE
jgi:hypothetical protein